MNSFVSAVILAAGTSSRMGRLKQLIPIKGVPLLQNTLQMVAASKCRETVLVLGYQAEEIRKTLSPGENTRIVINDSYEKGMSASIQVGLRNASNDADAALIILADQPFISSQVIDLLIAEKEISGASILFPVYNGFRGNPVLIDRSLFPEMMQIQGDIGCRSLFGLHPEKIKKVPVDDIGVLIDIDTEADLENIDQLKNRPVDERDRYVGDSSVQRHLLVVGSGDVASSVVEIGKFLQFRVTVVDPLLRKEDSQADDVIHELDLGRAGIVKNTFIVIASRGRFDEEALEQAVQTPAASIALLGSKKRGSELIQRLRGSGVSEERLQKIQSPAGVEIHAREPREIALSVMAQIIDQYNRMNYVE